MRGQSDVKLAPLVGPPAAPRPAHLRRLGAARFCRSCDCGIYIIHFLGACFFFYCCRRSFAYARSGSIGKNNAGRLHEEIASAAVAATAAAAPTTTAAAPVVNIRRLKDIRAADNNRRTRAGADENSFLSVLRDLSESIVPGCSGAAAENGTEVAWTRTETLEPFSSSSSQSHLIPPSPSAGSNSSAPSCPREGEGEVSFQWSLWGFTCNGSSVVAMNLSSPSCCLGSLPSSLGSLTSLTNLTLATTCRAPHNHTIPAWVANLLSLQILDLSGMGLTGSLPDALSSLQDLRFLRLSENRFFGSIPQYFANFSLLASLELQNNFFTGPIPGLFTATTALAKLDLSRNRFSGQLPEAVGQMSWLAEFNASSNPLGGTLPESFGNLVNATLVDLSHANISGSIPSSWGSMRSLHFLHLDNNSIEGSIPSTLGNLLSLQELYLNGNALAGPMPACWSVATDLYGIVVDSSVVCPQQQGAGVTCSSPTAAPDLNTTFCSDAFCASFCKAWEEEENQEEQVEQPRMGVGVAVVIVLAADILLIFAGVMVAKCLRERSKRKREQAQALTKAESWSRGLNSSFRKFSLEEMRAATDNFCEGKALAEDGFGTVFKGTGPKGEEWAVKRASVKGKRRCDSHVFHQEVREACRLCHENLVQLLGFCDDDLEQILVYEYMDMGTLTRHLYTESSEPMLSLEQRLQVAVDVAEGISYLHNQCEPPVTHREISPHSILLTSRHAAEEGHDVCKNRRLLSGVKGTVSSSGKGDLGVVSYSRDVGGDGGHGLRAKISNSGFLKGCLPSYMDPEANRFGVMAPKCDVFSFGVVLLELVSGRRATDVIHPNAEDLEVGGGDDDSSGLMQWALSSMASGDVAAVMDERLDLDCEAEAVMRELVEIAAACVQVPGLNRPCAYNVCVQLRELQKKHLSQNKMKELGRRVSISSQSNGEGANTGGRLSSQSRQGSVSHPIYSHSSSRSGPSAADDDLDDIL